MDKLHKYINNYKYISHYPKYIIKKYIKTYPNNYFEIGYIYEYYYINCDKMKKYYMLAINSGNSNAMYFLGTYYGFIKKEYDYMKAYLIAAMELGNLNAIIQLGNYYHNEQDYKLMHKYYNMIIEDSRVMYSLGHYYQHIEVKYGLMKKYYKMTIKLESIKLYSNYIRPHSMNNLAYYNAHIKKNYKLMKKYYIMAIKLNFNLSIKNICIHYKTDFAMI